MNYRTLPVILLVACIGLCPSARAQATSSQQTKLLSPPPFRPGELWPDTDGTPINAHGGGFLFHEGVYYWFGQFMTEGPAGNVANVGVAVYSSRDLYHWKNDGIALKVSEDPSSDIVKGSVIERPKVLYNAKTKTFVMWFHFELKGQGYSAARAGVATSTVGDAYLEQEDRLYGGLPSSEG